MARGRPRETAALRLLVGWVYLADPHYFLTQIPLSPLLFIDEHSSRMKIEKIDERQRKRKREKERKLLLFSLLSALLLRCPSFRFSAMRKIPVTIALLRNYHDKQLPGNFANILIIYCLPPLKEFN